MLDRSVFSRAPEEPRDPEHVIMGYPWPSSRLSRGDMIRLCQMRARTRKPLTKLLHEAVSAYYQLLSGTGVCENDEAPSLCCESPRLVWRGTIDNAAVHCVSCGFVLADDGQLGDWHDPEQIAWEQQERHPGASVPRPGAETVSRDF